MNRYIIVIIIFLSATVNTQAQDKLSLSGLIDLAMQNNRSIQIADNEMQSSKIMLKTAYDFDKTQFTYEYDPVNIDENNLTPYKMFSVSQDFKFPSFYGARKKVLETEYAKQIYLKQLKQTKIEKELHKLYQNLLFLTKKEQNLHYLDSLYQKFAKNAQRKFDLGESNALEKLTAQAKFRKNKLLLSQITAQKEQVIRDIRQVVQAKNNFGILIDEQLFKRLNIKQINLSENIYLSLLNENKLHQQAIIKQQKREMLPDFSVGYTYGNNFIPNGKPYSAYQFGISIPIFFSSGKSKVKAASMTLKQQELRFENEKLLLQNKYEKLMQSLQNQNELLQYFEQEGKQLSEKIYQTAQKSFQAGEIDFFQYIQSIENALEIDSDYLEKLLQYNLNIIEINYLTQ
jgi:cobalt-zinc-cadmium resistance protein CzcA